MIKNASFRPAWWLRHRHAQTIWPNLFRLTPKVDIRPERIELPDGDFIDLAWTKGNSGPIVVIFHGLGGCVESRYAKGLLKQFHRIGWRGVVMHFRGASHESNRLARGYHAGESEDTGYIIDLLAKREPHTRIAAVGISIGGSALLNLLAKRPDLPLRAAVAVSVPFDLHQIADVMDRGFSRLYQWNILNTLKRKAQEKFRRITPPFDYQCIRGLRNFRQFDDVITGPLHGYRDARHYYDECSALNHLRSIQHHTLIIHAADDPFMNRDCIPDKASISATTTLEVFEKGGHVGFVSGRIPFMPHYWLETRIPSYLKHYL